MLKIHSSNMCLCVPALCIGSFQTKKQEIVLIFSSAWLCQQSSWSWNLSVHRPSVRLWHRLSLKLLHGFLSYVICHMPRCYFHFWKKKILNFFVNMGPYRGENFKTLLLLQIAAKSFETCNEFSSQWSSQKYIGDFWILSFWFLIIFFRKFQIHHCSQYGEIKNLNYLVSGKQAIVEQNGVKFGTRG